MPRPLRVEYPGAMYHVMSRGDRREAIYEDEKDRQVFLKTLGEACAKTGWDIHAFVLMSNHFHLVMETPQPNLCVGMKWLLGTYTQRWNRRWRRWGHLFGGRYKAQCIDERSPSYLRTACDYVHLNPERAGLLPPEDGLESYAWSSFPAYLRKRSRPEWLRSDRLLGEHRCEDTSAGRRQFGGNLERQRRESAPDDDLKVMRRGWRIGAEDFGDWLGAKLARRGARTERARERRETDERWPADSSRKAWEWQDGRLRCSPLSRR